MFVGGGHWHCCFCCCCCCWCWCFLLFLLVLSMLSLLLQVHGICGVGSVFLLNFVHMLLLLLFLFLFLFQDSLVVHVVSGNIDAEVIVDVLVVDADFVVVAVICGDVASFNFCLLGQMWFDNFEDVVVDCDVVDRGAIVVDNVVVNVDTPHCFLLPCGCCTCQPSP